VVGIAAIKHLLAPGFLADIKARWQYQSKCLFELSAKHCSQGEPSSVLLRALIGW